MMLPKLYPITDVNLSRLSHAEQIEMLAAGGATLIQLREKKAAPREFYAAAVAAMRVARRLGVKLIINDRVDIALAVDADGVHLGQDDLPPEQARKLLGEQRIIGYSTHDLKQALAADLMAIDYIAIGPVFQTSTKENPDPVVGLELISQLKSQIAKPLVAIGGITLESAASVLCAGADSVAVISDLFVTADLSKRAAAYLAL
ncbi:MAG: thiamine phosphate synthase [Acidobacteriota bacterium]